MRGCPDRELVSLFKALGGGWKEEAAEPVAKERQIFRQ